MRSGDPPTKNEPTKIDDMKNGNLNEARDGGLPAPTLFGVGDVVVANEDQSDDRIDLCKRGDRLVITDIRPLGLDNLYQVLWEWLWLKNPKAYGFLIKRSEVSPPNNQLTDA
jgi:hypothetical protein